MEFCWSAAVGTLSHSKCCFLWCCCGFIALVYNCELKLFKIDCFKWFWWFAFSVSSVDWSALQTKCPNEFVGLTVTRENWYRAICERFWEMQWLACPFWPDRPVCCIVLFVSREAMLCGTFDTVSRLCIWWRTKCILWQYISFHSCQESCCFVTSLVDKHPETKRPVITVYE